MKVNIVITAGGTSEKIDNVRKITNSGSGKLGYLIANKLTEYQGDLIDRIYYICSKGSYKPSNEKIEIIEIVDTEDLTKKVTALLTENKIDFFIHSMAVSDYTVDYITTAEKLANEIKENKNTDIITIFTNYKGGIKSSKISSYEDNLIIKLKRTPKVISMIKHISPQTFLVGFKLLYNVSENELLDVAIKLKNKNKCNLVVANDLKNIREGTHKAFIIKQDNSFMTALGKENIAINLVKEMLKNANF